MKLMTVMIMAGLFLTLPGSAQNMRERQASGQTLGAGKSGCPKGGGTCDGTGPKGQGKGNGNCQRGQRGGNCGRR